MKVSEYLRRYQLSGELPDDGGDSMLTFWAGWLTGICYRGTVCDVSQAREMAVKIAEFIEAHVRE
jgi:hypothetical protein